MPANPPLRHHYIPEFYLKNWNDSEGRLLRYTKPLPQKLIKRRCHPSEVGFEYGLYSAPIEDDLAAQKLETDFFSPIDNQSAKALTRLLSHETGPLHREIIEYWSIFVMSLLFRHPTAFKYLLEYIRKLFHNPPPDFESRYSQLRPNHFPPTLADAVKFLEKKNNLSLIFNAIPHMTFEGEMLSFLRNLNWAILVVSEPKFELLISDDPLIRTNGIKKWDGHVALPLSPNRLMIGTWHPQKLSNFMCEDPNALFKRANIQIVESARQFVAAKTDHQRRFIENRFGRNPRLPLINEFTEFHMDVPTVPGPIFR